MYMEGSPVGPGEKVWVGVTSGICQFVLDWVCKMRIMRLAVMLCVVLSIFPQHLK